MPATTSPAVLLVVALAVLERAVGTMLGVSNHKGSWHRQYRWHFVGTEIFSRQLCKQGVKPLKPAGKLMANTAHRLSGQHVDTHVGC